MYTTIVALALLGAAPADTPITPLEEAIVTVGQTMDEGITLCATVGETGATIDDLGAIGGVEVAVLLKDMAVDYFADMLEDGMGPDYAMTMEAEASFEGWIVDCLG